MQIDTLKMFCDLIETHSVTKTAQINQVTQSAISQQISSLERIFKSLLIDRSTRSFRLTPEGQVLYDYSRQILEAYALIHGKIQKIKNIVSGTIRIATIYSIGLHELPPYIRKLLKTHPTVKVHMEYRRDNQVYEDVLGNLVDLGLVSYPENSGKLEVVPLWKDKLVLICHPQNPLAKRKSIKLADIVGQNSHGAVPGHFEGVDLDFPQIKLPGFPSRSLPALPLQSTGLPFLPRPSSPPPRS